MFVIEVHTQLRACAAVDARRDLAMLVGNQQLLPQKLTNGSHNDRLYIWFLHTHRKVKMIVLMLTSTRQPWRKHRSPNRVSLPGERNIRCSIPAVNLGGEGDSRSILLYSWKPDFSVVLKNGLVMGQ